MIGGGTDPGAGSGWRIGPVTAPNRFYQVPHSTGMGYCRPQSLAAMRGDGLEVMLVTPADEVSTWITHTEEQHRIQERILNVGIHIDRIGDCLAPGTIASSVYSGHKYAREMDADVPVGVPFRRER